MKNSLELQLEVPAQLQYGAGWGRFFLYREGGPESAFVSVAVCPSTIDALEDLLPESTWVAGLWGNAWRRVADHPNGRVRPEFEPGADEVLVALDAAGAKYAVAACPDDKPLSAARAWDSIAVVHRRMVRGGWRYLVDASRRTESDALEAES